MALFDALVKPALDSVSTLISQFHMSPEQQAQAQQALADASAKAQLASMDYDTKLNDIAGQNIRAEASNGDKWSERARPSVIWMGNLVIFWNYCLTPTFGAFWKLAPVQLPDLFWWTWGAVVTGYVFNRTAEAIATHVAGLPGDSMISLPGFRIGNKS